METDLESQFRQAEEKLSDLKRKREKVIEDSKIVLEDGLTGTMACTNPLRLGHPIPTDTVIILEEGLSIHCHSYKLMEGSKYFLEKLKDGVRTLHIPKNAEFSPIVLVQWLECLYNESRSLAVDCLQFPEVCLKTLKYFEASCLKTTIQKMVNVYVSKGHIDFGDYGQCNIFEFSSVKAKEAYLNLVKKIRSVGLDVPPLPATLI